MKTVAFYLPQFHRIKENDEWWGENFTEWTNVKKSQPQYRGHIQPEVPIKEDYYSLLDSNVQEKQAKLALENGVDAFCYYHYWFEGKLLLEKPMENMLHNKNINIPFMICWANETWSRNWDGKEADVLIKQNYEEDETAWSEHFLYLLDFFKDDRYVKKNDCPVLVIYKPYLIKNCKKMIGFFRNMARENGFPDLYIGYQYHDSFDYNMDEMGFDFGIEFEPFYTVHEIDKEKQKRFGLIKRVICHPNWMCRKLQERILHTPTIYYYDEIWKRINKRVPVSENIMPGAFCSWDNTPRRGNKAIVFRGATPKKFSAYLKQRVKRVYQNYNSEFLFINAWNEWAEGAHLEPDEHNQYGYLNAVKTMYEK